MRKRAAPRGRGGGTRLSRRRSLVRSGPLVAAAACTTPPVRAPSGGVTEGTVKLTAWTMGPDAPSYYRRDNLISAAETLNKKLAGKPTVEIDATFESGGQGGDYIQKVTLAARAKPPPELLLPGPQKLAPCVRPR